MMIRKDFERIAQVFRVNRPIETDKNLRSRYNVWSRVLDDMCVELKAINPRFDEARFRAACEKGL